MAADLEGGDNIGMLVGTRVFSLVGDGTDCVLDNEEILFGITLLPRIDVNADGPERSSGEFEDVVIPVGSRPVE